MLLRKKSLDVAIRMANQLNKPMLVERMNFLMQAKYPDAENTAKRANHAPPQAESYGYGSPSPSKKRPQPTPEQGGEETAAPAGSGKKKKKANPFASGASTPSSGKRANKKTANPFSLSARK